MTQTARTIAHTEYSLGWGGQEIRIFTEMQALRARGHRLLLCAPARSRIYQQAQTDGFPVLEVFDRRNQLPRSVWRMATWFRRERVAVVNMHSSGDGWAGGLAARLASVPLILRSRHIEVDYPNPRLSRIAFHHLPH